MSQGASESDATAADDGSDGTGLTVTALVVGVVSLVAGVAGFGLGLSARRRSS